ncbi:MAG: hypothetical protein IJU92_00685, partial [Spirochaetaceae bacterium]|nr:hypothetical protein [Spirochaetaceae bacterium]
TDSEFLRNSIILKCYSLPDTQQHDNTLLLKKQNSLELSKSVCCSQKKRGRYLQRSFQQPEQRSELSV